MTEARERVAFRLTLVVAVALFLGFSNRAVLYDRDAALQESWILARLAAYDHYSRKMVESVQLLAARDVTTRTAGGQLVFP